MIVFQQLKIRYVMVEGMPTPLGRVSRWDQDLTPAVRNLQFVSALAKYEEDNQTVRGILLNHMNNTLFDLFLTNESAKSI